MVFKLLIYDEQSLRNFGQSFIRADFPHIRVVVLPAINLQKEIINQFPVHIQNIFDTSGSKESLEEINFILTADKLHAAYTLKGVPNERFILWNELTNVYRHWMETVYLRHNASVALYTSESLQPIDQERGEIVIEYIGDCLSRWAVRYAKNAGKQLNFNVVAYSTLLNHPIRSSHLEDGFARCPTFRVIIPPFRYMHPSSMDIYYHVDDYEAFFEQARNHMFSYLDVATRGFSSVPNFILGFTEPHMNPTGLLLNSRSLDNLKYFVRCLNDEIEGWCDDNPAVYYVDGNELAGAVGKVHVDEDAAFFTTHRAPLDPHDDWIERDSPMSPYSFTKSFDSKTPLYYTMLHRELITRYQIIGEKSKVKVVIVDLDNTLWRGLASDGVLGSFNGRPQAIIEALLILKRRGILLAICSKNDDDYIVHNWNTILNEMSEVPLTCKLSLDDFAIRRINFRPKSENIKEILNALNILPHNAVFIDDSSLEREEVQTAIPEIRILGSELNYIRRDLLFSPYTQTQFITEEDKRRTQMIRSRINYVEQSSNEHDPTAFLTNLGLKCDLYKIHKSNQAGYRRALQLINKTNQWNLNGCRISQPEFESLVINQDVWCAEVEDKSTAYGCVVVCIVRDSSLITHMVVSCRVIGFQIEDAVLSEIQRIYDSDRMSMDYVPTDRNLAVRDFLFRNNMEFLQGGVDIPKIETPRHIFMSLSQV